MCLRLMRLLKIKAWTQKTCTGNYKKSLELLGTRYQKGYDERQGWRTGDKAQTLGASGLFPE